MKRLVLALFTLLFLASPVIAQSAIQEAKDHLVRNAFRHGLSTADVSDLAVTNAYTSRRSGATHVYLRQEVGGIEVVGSEMTVNVDRSGRVFHTAGAMVPSLNQRVRSQSASLDAMTASLRAASFVDVQNMPTLRVSSSDASANQATSFSTNGLDDNQVRAKLVYKQNANGAYRLAWEVELALQAENAYWLVYVDAISGEEVARIDLVVNDNWGTESAENILPAAASSFLPFETEAHALAAMAPSAIVGSYRVFQLPVESPKHASPPLPADGRTLHANPDDPTASPFGWHDTDGAPGAESTLTTGNNVDAHKGAARPDGTASLIFDNPADFSMSPITFVPAATTNTFYHSNVFHDVMYHYGFDEVSGNFQENNYGNGGLGSDGVNANVQASGNCNANFGTPSDGQNPTMNMFLCTTPNPDADTDFDTVVIQHEITHGISNRLTGGPANVGCLSNAEQMGEGWSDWYGIMTTIEPGDDRTDRRGVATYSLTGEGPTGNGIRPAPYSTDFGINGFTYQDTRTQTAPHGVGFVWATIIWEVTWDLIDRDGFNPNVYQDWTTGGNNLALQLVTDGLKLQACSPGFVDGRDAILAADIALTGGANIDLLWDAFARRGLGFSADQGSSGTNSDNTEAFNTPEAVPPAPVDDLAAAPACEGIELTWTAVGDDGNTGTADSYDIRYSTSPITNDPEFDAATQVSGEPDPLVAGSAESFVVTGLPFNATRHFAMKVSDESFNISPLSNSASATTGGPPVLSVDTTPITVAVFPGDTATRNLAVGNTGASCLSYGIDFTETTTGPLDPQGGGVITPPTNPIPDVKGGLEIPGSENLRGSGGPDAFGYTWIDSNEPGGPVFVWTDISGTGTSISLTDDDFEEVALPFSFDFYGIPQAVVKIGSNGYLTFGGDGTDFSNDPIPTATDPNDFIAPFWDDLNPADGGTIHYQDMGDGRFIVQYTDIHRFSDGATTLTFQAVLNSGGSMTFYYDSMVGTLNSATIGIENATATDGLQVINNAPYVEDGLAVRISAIWVSATPTGGVVAPASSENVELFFDSAGLALGTYTADMTITTNEPDGSASITVIPLTFIVDLNPPVELTAFTAALDGEDVVLNWSTDSETNNSGFEVQRLNGEDAPEVLGFVEGNGTTTEVHTYAFRATGLDVGTYSFRLKQVDFDGAFEYSPEVEVTVGVIGTHRLSSVYPNPFNPRAQFTLAVGRDQNVAIDVFDSVGRKVSTLFSGAVTANETQTVVVDGASLASGTYFVRITGETFADTQRITLLK